MSSEVENIQEQKVAITYSEWNKLVIPSAETNSKKLFNVLKYGLALLLAIISLISLWFAANWQTANVLSTIGIDINKWNNYLSTNDTLGNKELIAAISEFRLWDLKGAVINADGVQGMVAIGIMALASLVPLLIFKNGTVWSIGSITMSSVLLIIIIALFSLGLESQSNAIKVNTISLGDVASIDRLNALIADNQAMIKVPSGNELLTPQEQIQNNIINNLIDGYIAEKNNLLSEFMQELNDYLNLL